MPGPYKQGQPINLVDRFYTIDPITKLKTLADPTTVTYTVMDPNDEQTVYTFGVDGNVTKLAVGIYMCALAPPHPSGIWQYESAGTGAVVAQSGVKSFEVLPNDMQVPLDLAEVPTPGPCLSWIDGVDVQANCPNAAGIDCWELDPIAAMASNLMYELSGRQFVGICERKVRPCRQACGCFGVTSMGLGPWYWTSAFYGGEGWWRNDCGDKCGCGSESYIRLAGYPVREILQVKIDGQVLDPDTDYRLDNWKRLIRLSDPGPPVMERAWPVCQQLDLDDDQPGTFSVTYKWGTPPPELGKRAAAQLACELYAATSGAECQLPSRVTKVVRQGVSMERVVPTADLLRSGMTGLPLVDMFIAQYNPTGMKRRPAVFSPDLQPYARRLGQNQI